MTTTWAPRASEVICPITSPGTMLPCSSASKGRSLSPSVDTSASRIMVAHPGDDLRAGLWINRFGIHGDKAARAPQIQHKAPSFSRISATRFRPTAEWL